MATVTATAIELEVLNQETASKNSPALESSARISLSIPGPTSSILDHEPATKNLPKGRSWIVIVQLAGINFITSFSNGLVTIGLPAMAADLKLANNLLVWPTAAFALTSGSLLLLAGSVADVVGCRSVNLIGSFFIALFTLLSGVSSSGNELIAFRALQGVASALTFPTAVSIISRSIESGQRRNIGLACLGLAMPLGFSIGLVLGGVLISGVGWRIGTLYFPVHFMLVF
jgi:MFS family permease